LGGGEKKSPACILQETGKGEGIRKKGRGKDKKRQEKILSVAVRREKREVLKTMRVAYKRRKKEKVKKNELTRKKKGGYPPQ